jgi:hypothetical protein
MDFFRLAASVFLVVPILFMAWLGLSLLFGGGPSPWALFSLAVAAGLAWVARKLFPFA